MCEIKEMLKEQRPTIVILLEPRISGDTADVVCKKIGKTRWIRSEARGFSGGVWVMWDEEDIDLKLRYDDAFFLHCLARSRGGLMWEVTAVYASPTPMERKFLWAKLNGIRTHRPWVLVGDFNCVLRNEERSSNSGASSCFQNWVGERGLLDLGFIGNKFTWRHGRSVETRRAARLDRALCCDAWRRLFPSAKVRHLSHSHSDHCPLLLDLSGEKGRRLGTRPFKFQAAWLLHSEYQSWMERAWRDEGDLTVSLKRFSEKLNVWNREVFGCIFKRKKEIRSRLERLLRILDAAPTPSLLDAERRLKKDWSEVLIQEETLWMQKSRVDWLRLGDRNTKYFHTKTLVRRRRNRVEMLKNEDGQWVEDAVELKKMAVSFYESLFKSEPRRGGQFIHGAFPPIDPGLMDTLDKEATEDEIRNALRSMGSYKAPGPDGFQPVFFKKTWNTTGAAVTKFVREVLRGEPIPEGAAEALLVLIPKGDRAESMRSFRPLSLCNTVTPHSR